VSGNIYSTSMAGVVAAPLLWGVSFLARSARVVGLGSAERRIADVREKLPGRKLAFYHWVEDVLPRLVVARASGTSVDFGAVYVCDDTIGGQIGAALMATLGRRVLPFRLAGGGLRIRDLQALIREPAPLSLAADGRGPYGSVHPSLPRLIEARAGVAIPVSVVASPVLRSRRGGRLAVPMFRATLAVAVGAPVVADDSGARRLAVDELEKALSEARIESLRLLRGA